MRTVSRLRPWHYSPCLGDGGERIHLRRTAASRKPGVMVDSRTDLGRTGTTGRGAARGVHVPDLNRTVCSTCQEQISLLPVPVLVVIARPGSASGTARRAARPAAPISRVVPANLVPSTADEAAEPLVIREGAVLGLRVGILAVGIEILSENAGCPAGRCSSRPELCSAWMTFG